MVSGGVIAVTNAPIYYDNADQVVPVTVTFTKADGTGTAPAVVAITITDPHGVATSYTYTGGNVDPNTVVSDGSGSFHIWLTNPATSGLWTYVWMGSGGAVNQGFQIFTGTFRVLSYSDTGLGMTQWYCSKEELKSRLQIAASDTKDDYEIQLAIQATTDWITTYTGRHFYRVSEVRTYKPLNVWTLEIDDLVTCTSVDLDYDGDGIYEVHWTENVNYQLLRYPDNYNAHDMGVARPNNYLQVTSGTPGNAGGQWLPWIVPFTQQNRVKITGIWGWADVPPNVTAAALVLAADMFKTKDAPWGIAGFGDLGMVKVQANPLVTELLRPYINVSAKVGV